MAYSTNKGLVFGTQKMNGTKKNAFQGLQFRNRSQLPSQFGSSLNKKRVNVFGGRLRKQV